MASVVEQWRAITGYEGAYEVSTFGQVRSLDRLIGGQRPGSTRRWKGRILTPVIAEGYNVVSLCKEGRVEQRHVAHLVLEAFRESRPPGMQACHWDDDPDNDNLINLRWGTPSDNGLDKVRNGRCWLVGRGKRAVECRWGHQLRMPNLVAYILETEDRKKCLACTRATNQRYKARLAGRLFDFKTTANRIYREIMKSPELEDGPSPPTVA